MRNYLEKKAYLQRSGDGVISLAAICEIVDALLFCWIQSLTIRLLDLSTYTFAHCLWGSLEYINVDVRNNVIPILHNQKILTTSPTGPKYFFYKVNDRRPSQYAIYRKGRVVKGLKCILHLCIPKFLS